MPVFLFGTTFIFLVFCDSTKVKWLFYHDANISCRQMHRLQSFERHGWITHDFLHESWWKFCKSQSHFPMSSSSPSLPGASVLCSSWFPCKPFCWRVTHPCGRFQKHTALIVSLKKVVGKETRCCRESMVSFKLHKCAKMCNKMCNFFVCSKCCHCYLEPFSKPTNESGDGLSLRFILDQKEMVSPVLAV